MSVEKQRARIARARTMLGRASTSDEDLCAWLADHASEGHEDVDLSFLAASILEARGEDERAREWYASIARRASANAEVRQRALLGGLDARLRQRVWTWIGVALAALFVLSSAALYGAFVLWILAMSQRELALSDPAELPIVAWLAETQTAELCGAAGELGAEGGGGTGGAGGGGEPMSPEAMLRALLEESRGGGRGGPRGGQPGTEGHGGGSANGVFEGPSGAGPPPRALPPPPPTPPDPPQDITLGAGEHETGPARTCSAIERPCDLDALPPADREASAEAARSLSAAIFGLSEARECEELASIVARAPEAIDRPLAALAERHAAACYLARARSGDATEALAHAQAHAERSACAQPDEAWRAYLLMVTGAMQREALAEASGYLGCARRSVSEYERASSHPLDTAEAYASLAAWEWSVMGNEAGFRDAQGRAEQVLLSLPPNAEVDAGDARRVRLAIDAQWLELHAGTAELAPVFERAITSPELDEPHHLVLRALEVIHHLLAGETELAAERLSALIERYRATSESHASWTWSGLERRVMADPSRADVARQVLVLTRVFTGARTDAKILELRGLLASIGGAR
jgi:hypothetical protein